QSKHRQVGVGGADPASASRSARAGVLGTTVTALMDITATVGTRTMAIGTMGIGATATTVTAAIGPVTHIADGTNPVGASFQIRRASSSTRDEGVGFDRRPVPLMLRGGVGGTGTELAQRRSASGLFRRDPMAATKRKTSKRKTSKRAPKNVESAMRRRKRGTLKSGSGRKVTSKKQAIAIGLSEARKKGKKAAKKPNLRQRVEPALARRHT